MLHTLDKKVDVSVQKMIKVLYTLCQLHFLVSRRTFHLLRKDMDRVFGSLVRRGCSSFIIWTRGRERIGRTDYEDKEEESTEDFLLLHRA